MARAKGEAAISAWSAVGSGAQQVNYRMAVLGVLQMSWLRLATYSEILRRQVVNEVPGLGPENFDPDSIVTSEGLVGYRYGAAGSSGTIYAVSEEVRSMVQLEAAERDRVVKYAETAHKMGIDDRMTDLAERWGDVVATRITLLLDALELTPQQALKVPSLVTRHLSAIETDMIGGKNR